VIKVGFVVEGVSDKKLIESAAFKDFAQQKCGLEILDEVVDAGGNKNMCSQAPKINFGLPSAQNKFWTPKCPK
jgi:hypothetical protein